MADNNGDPEVNEESSNNRASSNLRGSVGLLGIRGSSSSPTRIQRAAAPSNVQRTALAHRQPVRNLLPSPHNVRAARVRIPNPKGQQRVLLTSPFPVMANLNNFATPATDSINEGSEPKHQHQPPLTQPFHPLPFNRAVQEHGSLSAATKTLVKSLARKKEGRKSVTLLVVVFFCHLNQPCFFPGNSFTDKREQEEALIEDCMAQEMKSNDSRSKISPTNSTTLDFLADGGGKASQCKPKFVPASLPSSSSEDSSVEVVDKPSNWTEKKSLKRPPTSLPVVAAGVPNFPVSQDLPSSPECVIVKVENSKGKPIKVAANQVVQSQPGRQSKRQKRSSKSKRKPAPVPAPAVAEKVLSRQAQRQPESISSPETGDTVDFPAILEYADSAKSPAERTLHILQMLSMVKSLVGSGRRHVSSTVLRVTEETCDELVKQVGQSPAQIQDENYARWLHRRNCIAHNQFLAVARIDFKERACIVYRFVPADCDRIDFWFCGCCLPPVGVPFKGMHKRMKKILQDVLCHPLWDEKSREWCECFQQGDFTEWTRRFKCHLSEAGEGNRRWPELDGLDAE